MSWRCLQHILLVAVGRWRRSTRWRISHSADVSPLRTRLQRCPCSTMPSPFLSAMQRRRSPRRQPRMRRTPEMFSVVIWWLLRSTVWWCWWRVFVSWISLRSTYVDLSFQDHTHFYITLRLYTIRAVFKGLRWSSQSTSEFHSLRLNFAINLYLLPEET